MNIVLVGQESAGVKALWLIAQSSHRLVAVLTGNDSGDGAERGVTVGAVARDLGVPVLPAHSVKDPAFATELRRQQVDVLLNVHSLYLIRGDVLAAPRFGSFNLHPGPLPQYAGLNAPSWALYHGRETHGVTLHWMEPGIDTGDVAFSASFPLTPADTGLTVSAKCVQMGVPLIAELLERLALPAPDVPALPQNLDHRQYFSREVPYDGWLPWDLPARQIVDFVRACDYGPWPSPWGSPRCRAGDRELAVLRAAPTGAPADAPPGTVGLSEGAHICVAAADEWVLVQRVRANGAVAAPSEILRPGRAAFHRARRRVTPGVPPASPPASLFSRGHSAEPAGGLATEAAPE